MADAAEAINPFDLHEAPTRAYATSTSGVRLAIGRDQSEAEPTSAPVADEIPTLPEMPAAPLTIEPPLPPPAPEGAPADTIADEGAFFEAPPRYTMTSVAPPPVVMVTRRAPRFVAKLLFATLGAGVLLLGAVELAVACLR